MQVLRVLISLGVIVLLFSCGNDDNADFEVIPPRRLSEVVTEDAAALQEYLQTHFYNYEDFENPPAGFDFRIVLDTIAGDNAGKTPLIDRPELQTLTIPVSSESFNLDSDETVDHTMYYLVARDGVGDIPSIADSTLVRYEGTLLNGALFD
ncbi:MAG: hypothetical protein KJP14_02345, partial [Eudoraea sp.]|nr:hypothetical protein [Eudoraea sp.]